MRDVRRALMAVFPLMLMVMPLFPSAQAQTVPVLPCEEVPVPAYAPPGQPPSVRVWSENAPQRNWEPPPCTGGSADRDRVLVTVAATFRTAVPGLGGRPDGLIARVGAISTLTGVRYWSVSDEAWQPLVTSATALSGPGGAPRRDFTPADISAGRDLFFVQTDSRSSGPVTFRIRVLEAGPNAVRFTVENVSPIDLFVITLFGPGDLQSFHSLERRSSDTWAYYGLLRAGAGASRLAGGHERFYVNRAVAFYRFLAGVPTDRDPPVAR
ncbi:DUF6675 family protein [Azospirillum canadense]|uniref:DUF6675 family protein n=1 Tax=Azospirillum canadense TaxID=403962 RepID=UPI002227DE1B|nr:DUF6675 family protein [Azospirillum canadense]MCW2239637.1 hypothetical protein [Azospirillum canadense]